MGRRPNPLIGEFFERGEKLDDASNRYQHTCKRCGELFPKGRIDSLMTHLLRKCPNVTAEDRHWLVAQYQPSELRKSEERKRARPSGLSQDDPQVVAGRLPSYSVQQQQQQSALDTLAEVSRRHLDGSTPQPLDTHGQSEQSLGQAFEQTLVRELRRHGDAHENEASMIDFSGTVHDAATALAHTSDDLDVSQSVISNGLVQTASAANTHLEHSQADHAALSNSAVDPQLREVSWLSNTGLAKPDPRHTQDSEDRPGAQLALMTEIGEPAEAAGVRTEQPASRLEGLPQPVRTKARSRFDDARRAEVREIRKRGACLRCRMLKKPCSQEIPCSACRNVEAARLWKGACIRTRLSEECPLWSAQVFRKWSNDELPVEGQHSAPSVIYGQIRARHPDISELNVTVACIASAGGLAVDPSIANADLPLPGDIRLVIEGDGAESMIQPFVSEVIESLIGREHDPLLQSVLEQAQLVLNTEAGRQPHREEQRPKPARSSYNLQTRLLSDVVELWIGTRWLTENEDTLQLQYDQHHSPPGFRFAVTSEDGSNELRVKSIPQGTAMHRRVRLQLLAAIESRCSKLSKSIVNELERRLMQRRQVSRFATFLAAVALLACVERIGAFYQALDPNPLSSESTHTELAEESTTSTPNPISADSAMTNPHPTNAPSHTLPGPLDAPSSLLCTQAEHFADLLTTLLRIRALPPAVAKTADGRLVATQAYGAAEHDADAVAAAAWLDPLRLDVATLVAQRDRSRVPGKDGGSRAWDLRFVLSALLPAGF